MATKTHLQLKNTHENHAIEIYRTEMIESRTVYIHENPVRAGIVEKPEDYFCASARNYAELVGLIAVDYWLFRPISNYKLVLIEGCSCKLSEATISIEGRFSFRSYFPIKFRDAPICCTKSP